MVASSPRLDATPAHRRAAAAAAAATAKVPGCQPHIHAAHSQPPGGDGPAHSAPVIRGHVHARRRFSAEISELRLIGTCLVCALRNRFCVILTRVLDAACRRPGLFCRGSIGVRVLLLILFLPLLLVTPPSSSSSSYAAFHPKQPTDGKHLCEAAEAEAAPAAAATL